jgi:hypothetical protein
VGSLVATALAGLAASIGAAADAGTRQSPAWIPVRSLATDFQPGQLPTRAHQVVLGRLKLNSIARVSSVRIHGKTTTGDQLVIQGEYQNLTTQPTYWTEGYAFVFGTSPTLCTLNTCGPLPAGDWSGMTHRFGKPIVDYPKTSKVAARSTVSFREAIPMPLVSPASASTTTTATTAAAPSSPAISSLRDIWLLPIYAAFNYYEQPFPRSQLIRLSSYFGRTVIPGA